jgi:hypothetical protein
MATRPMSDKIEDSNEFIQELLDEVSNQTHFEVRQRREMIYYF